MKKAIFSLIVIALLIMMSIVFAETNDNSLEEFIKKAAERRGILQEDIINITEVDFNDLPKEVNITDIADANIALFKIQSKTGEDSFILTFSDQGFQKISKAYFATSFLSFGMDEEKKTSTFLKMSSGVKGSLDNGYVMTRSGSITGISTNLNITESSNYEIIQIVIYKNREQIGLGNMIEASSTGIKKDYEIQSRDIVNFNAGDTISVYLDDSNSAGLKDVTTIVEISTSNN